MFVRDLQQPAAVLVSVATGGAPGAGDSEQPAISADGTHVAFVPAPRPAPRWSPTGRRRRGSHEGDAGVQGLVLHGHPLGAGGLTVTVEYATSDASATSPSDYTAKSGDPPLRPGVIDMKVKVKVTGALDNEVSTAVSDRNQAFRLNLSRVTGPAAIADFTAEGKIVEDDPPPVTGRRLTIGDAAVREGDAGTRTAVFTVSLSEPSNKTIVVDYATANGYFQTSGPAIKGDDYLGARGTLRFAPGTTSMAVAVAVLGDTVAAEGHHRFSVVLSNLAGSGTAITDGLGQGTILDDD